MPGVGNYSVIPVKKKGTNDRHKSFRDLYNYSQPSRHETNLTEEVQCLKSRQQKDSHAECVRDHVGASGSSDAFQTARTHQRLRTKFKRGEGGGRVLSLAGTTCVTVSVRSSVAARGVGGDQPLKTSLSHTVIPPHESARSHPLCTDKDSAGVRKLS